MGVITTGLALSLHLGVAGDYNEIHPYVQYENNNVQVGAYYNSDARLSTYLSYNFENDNGYFLELGVLSGYIVSDILPVVRVGKEITNTNMTVFAAPAYEDYFGLETNIGIVVGIEFDY